MSFFQGASDITISGSATFNEIQGNETVNIIRFGDEQFTETQRNLICDYIANLTVLPDISNNLTRHLLTQSIITLPRTQAAYNDYETKKKSGPCFQGTRVALIREMADWVISPGESRIYVLSGLAGIGKSTIAYTIATRADDLGLLGASFFFSRDEADRKNAKKFFTTIAYQLCVYNRSFAQAIGDALLTERGSSATTKEPEAQLQSLILEPLRNIVKSRTRPILVVVDALDECDAEDARPILSGFNQLVRDLPSFKVILTTRTQRLSHPQLGSPNGNRIFHLQDIEDKIVDGDIRLYLKHSFSQEQVQARLQDLEDEWHANDAEIDSLVRASGRLFIIASTAVRFILDVFASDPVAQMEKLLQAFARDHTPFTSLNDFYTVILRNVVPVDCDNADIVQRYRVVIGTIVFIQLPLPIMSLARLINTSDKQIRIVLRKLESIILLGSNDVPIIYHKSFPDYVTDLVRCKHIDLHIDSRTQHKRIAIRCFIIMDAHLRHNILGLTSPARFMDNESGLAHQGLSEEQLQQMIPSELRYACVYWAYHLESANSEDTCLMKELEKFANVHMLHWLEVLSLIKKLDVAHRSIHAALKLARATSSDLFQLLSDGSRFTMKFYETIRQSALHIYYSALPFTPTESLLYRRYSEEAVDGICRITGGPEKWSALLASPSTSNASYIKFSPDSTMFASGSGFGGVNIWDTATGIAVSSKSLLFLHTAITNDFSALASAENDVISLHSVKHGEPAVTFITRPGIQRLALSSESNRVATSLLGGTVCLWDSGNGQLVASFGCETVVQYPLDSDIAKLIAAFCEVENPGTFRFSPTGVRLVCTQRDGITQLRDAIDGALIANLDGLPKVYFELVFSHDGSRLAIFTDEVIRVWASDSGELVGNVMYTPCDYIHPTLAISANGSLLATRLIDKVQLWSGNSGNSHMLIDEIGLEQQDRFVLLEFSRDDMLAITTYYTIMIYDVKNCSLISTLPIVSVRVLAFSPDCTRLAAMNYSYEIQLWDVQAIRASSSPSKEKEKSIHDLVLSHDCAHLVCVFVDCTVELWETGPTKQRIPVHDGRGSQRTFLPLGFSADDKKFAAGLGNGIIKLWDSEDGAPVGSVKCSSIAVTLALSNHVLAAADHSDDITLWDLRTMHSIGTVKQPISNSLSFSNSNTAVPSTLWEQKMGIVQQPNSNGLSFSNNGGLLASFNRDNSHTNARCTVTVFDIMKLTEIITFNAENYGKMVHMAFLPDDLQLVVQLKDDEFMSFNLVSNEITHYTSAPPFNFLVHFRHFPLWHGIPVWLTVSNYFDCDRRLYGLFPQHEDPVTVLRILQDYQITDSSQGSSMIALGCNGYTVIFVQSTAHSVG